LLFVLALYDSLSFFLACIFWFILSIFQLNYNISLQTGGYTTANYIWDLMQARNFIPSPPAVEAYYKGLKVSFLPR